MEFRVLAIGDVTSEEGTAHLRRHLPGFKKMKGVDFTVINGENISGTGLTPQQADDLFAAGADVITLGNHTWGKMQITDYLEENRYILRPANFSPRTPGRGYGVYDLGRVQVAVMVLIGRCDLAWGSDNPFTTADRLLKAGEKPTFTLVDFHAQATSEKLAMAYYLDGRVSALWGTHTHVPTADERVFPHGTGYITDLGMTGAVESVLGIRPEQSVETFLGGLPGRYRPAEGPCKAQGALFPLDSATGLCPAVERVDIREIQRRHRIMSVEKVRAYLEHFGVSDRIREFDVSSATVELAAVAVGVEPARIAKTLSFKLGEDPILVVAAGDAKIDNSKYKHFFGMKAKMLTPEEAVERIGHAVGGVCPFALPEDVKTYLDESLRRFDTVFPAVGSAASAIELTCGELERCCGTNFVSWVDVCKGWQEESHG